MISLYLDGLCPAIASLLQQSRNTDEGCKYMKAVKQTNPKGEAVRPQKVFPSSGPVLQTTSMRQIWEFIITQFIIDSTYDPLKIGYMDAVAHLMNNFYAPTSVLFSFIPSKTFSEELEEEGQNNQFLVTRTKWRVVTPRIPKLVTNQWPRCVNQSPRQGKTDETKGVFWFKKTARKSFEDYLWQILRAKPLCFQMFLTTSTSEVSDSTKTPLMPEKRCQSR